MYLGSGTVDMGDSSPSMFALDLLQEATHYFTVLGYFLKVLPTEPGDIEGGVRLPKGAPRQQKQIGGGWVNTYELKDDFWVFAQMAGELDMLVSHESEYWP